MMITYSIKNLLFTALLIVVSFSAFANTPTNGDDRMKIRLGFNSANNIHRQLLVTQDQRATNGIDFGFDAEAIENHQDDMFWMIDNRKFSIQGLDTINTNTSLPLGLHSNTNGNISIVIDELINVPATLEITIFDTETNTYHNIKDNNGFIINLSAGNYLNRFELRFTNSTRAALTETATAQEASIKNVVEAETLSIEEETFTTAKPMTVKFVNNTKSIVINNIGNATLNTIQVYNFTGQLKAQFNNIATIGNNSTTIQTNNLTAGQYIIVVNTNTGTTAVKTLVK